jgi:acetolactate synthase-1/3 small subunit
MQQGGIAMWPSPLRRTTGAGAMAFLMRGATTGGGGVRYTLAALVENHFGVLARVAGLFGRRGFNIESLAVGPTEDPTVSRMTIVIDGDERVRDQIVRQMSKLIDAIDVRSLAPEATVSRELALIKVRANADNRSQIMQIVDVFRGQVVDVGKSSLMLELTGDEAKVGALLEVLSEFGVLEVARTGVVALARGAESMAVPDESEVPSA